MINEHTDHAEKMHEVPNENLVEILPIAKKIATALGCEEYNILQVRTLSITTPLWGLLQPYLE